MQIYLDLLDNILSNGRLRAAPRHSASTLSLFGEQLRFDLNLGFPLVTTRRVYARAAIEELLWFLSGSTDNQYLVNRDVHIWDKWAAPTDKLVELPLTFARSKATQMITKGDCGPIYGKMWRSWPNPDGTTIDQIKLLVENLKTKAYSRRHVISAWNPTLLPDETISPIENIYTGRQSLAPCHTVFQFIVEPLLLTERNAIFEKLTHDYLLDKLVIDEAIAMTSSDVELYDKLNIPTNRLSCKLFARSQDVPIGTVFNIISYSALTLMLCKQLNFAPGHYIHSMGDSHIYLDQVEQVKQQLTRIPYDLPKLVIRSGISSLFDYDYSDFSIDGYVSHPRIDYPVTE